MNVVSVFRRFSKQYFGICKYFLLQNYERENKSVRMWCDSNVCFVMQFVNNSSSSCHFCDRGWPSRMCKETYFSFYWTTEEHVNFGIIIFKIIGLNVTGQHDRQVRSLTGQIPNQLGHCPLTSRYFQPWNKVKRGAMLVALRKRWSKYYKALRKYYVIIF